MQVRRIPLEAREAVAHAAHNGNGNGNGRPHFGAAHPSGNGRGAGLPTTAARTRRAEEQIRRAATDIASALLAANSIETAAHSREVCRITNEICERLGLSAIETEEVTTAACLHDLGKVGVPARLLDKPGPLSDAEWVLIRRHTIIGEQIVRAVPELSSAGPLVRHSHERWDGCGYPDGLSGEEIPLGSRIIACADAFHAIREDRPYRAGRPVDAALAEIRACSGTQFDPRVVDALTQTIAVAPAKPMAGIRR